MTKLLFVTTFATLAVVACGRKSAKPLETTLRLRAEHAACGLDSSLFKAEEGAIQLNAKTFKALKENDIKPDDKEKVKEAKAKTNGVYTLKSAEVFKYVYGKEDENSVFTKGSTRIKFSAESGWQNDAISTEGVCDTLNTAAQSKPWQKPGPGQLVDINEEGVESFEIPSLAVKSKFASVTDHAMKKPMGQNQIEELHLPGDYPDKVGGSVTSYSYYKLPEDKGYLMIKYVERKTSIMVTRAVYSKQK